MKEKVIIWRNLFNRQLCHHSNEIHLATDEEQHQVQEKVNKF